jgi:hypothetical protein
MAFWLVLFSMISFHSFADSRLIYEANKKGIDLSQKDKTILEIGEISAPRYVIGGIIGTYPVGFGLGHAVQGRWSDKGWIFTAGEAGSLAVVVAGALGCLNNEFDNGFNGKDDCQGVNEALLVTGIIGFVGFRVWEIVDVWGAPFGHNKKVRELKDYINKASEKEIKTSLLLTPIINPRQGHGLGLTLVF